MAKKNQGNAPIETETSNEGSTEGAQPAADNGPAGDLDPNIVKSIEDAGDPPPSDGDGEGDRATQPPVEDPPVVAAGPDAADGSLPTEASDGQKSGAEAVAVAAPSDDVGAGDTGNPVG